MGDLLPTYSMSIIPEFLYFSFLLLCPNKQRNALTTHYYPVSGAWLKIIPLKQSVLS